MISTMDAISTPDDGLVGILVGTLVAMTTITMAFGVVVTLAIILGCKLQKRRREMRDLVERTKHDIFEGTGGMRNATPCDSELDDLNGSMHNVLNTSPTSPTPPQQKHVVFELPGYEESVADSGAQLTVHIAMEEHELS